MRKPQYEVTIILEGEPETSPELLRAAMGSLFKVAVRLPPDRRFDWRTAHIEAQRYAS